MTQEPPKIPVLMSYAFLRDLGEEATGRILSDPRFEFLVDSGGFTAFTTGRVVTLEAYIEWLERWKPYLAGYLALDVVQDPKQSSSNVQAMLERGLAPIPVHVFGDGQARMDHLFALSPWVALAGILRPGRGHAPKAYVAKKLQWAAGRKVHLLGYVRPDILTHYRPFSADSSSWRAGQKWGRMAMYLERGRWVTLTYPQMIAGRWFLREDVKRALARYHVTMEEFMDPHHWRQVNRAKGQRAKVEGGVLALNRIPTGSWVYYALEFMERFGTRIYLATVPGDFKHLDWAAQAVTRPPLSPQPPKG